MKIGFKNQNVGKNWYYVFVLTAKLLYYIPGYTPRLSLGIYISSSIFLTEMAINGPKLSTNFIR